MIKNDRDILYMLDCGGNVIQLDCKYGKMEVIDQNCSELYVFGKSVLTKSLLIDERDSMQSKFKIITHGEEEK